MWSWSAPRPIIGNKVRCLVQSLKRLDSLRQFCAVLQYGDGNSGENFYDLPEMTSETDKGEIEGKFESSPYFHSCRIPNFRNQGD